MGGHKGGPLRMGNLNRHNRVPQDKDRSQPRRDICAGHRWWRPNNSWMRGF